MRGRDKRYGTGVEAPGQLVGVVLEVGRDRVPSVGLHRPAEAGDKALRAFDTKAAQAAFASALKLDPTLPAAHRGMGMLYVLLGKNAEAKVEYARYLDLAPDAPDKDQIARLVSR